VGKWENGSGVRGERGSNQSAATITAINGC